MPKPNVAALARRAELPMQSREAAVQSVDPESRVVTLVWTTGAAVSRYSWMRGTSYEEILVVDKKSVRMDRLNNGAPLLNTHGQYDLASIIGVVEKAWLDNGEGLADVRFPKAEDNPEADAIFRQVKDKIIRNVSVGYLVHKYEIERNEDTGVEIWRAVDWEPAEISLVPIPADAGAGTRGASPLYACEFIARRQPKENTMPKPNKQAAGDTTVENEDDNNEVRETPKPVPQPSDQSRTELDAAITGARASGVTAERTRVKTIKERTRAAGLPDDVADDLIERGVEVPHVGDALVDAMAARGGSANARIRVGTDNTDPEVIRERMAVAIAARGTAGMPQGARTEMSAESRQYAGLGMLDMFADLARARGLKIDHRMKPAPLYDLLVEQRSLSTSDFPLLLASASNKILLGAYGLAAPTFKQIFARKTFNDFKAHNFLRLGDFPNLLAKGEAGEFKYGTVSESRQQITAAEYGRILRISRRIIINDDLAAFSDIPAMAGRRAAVFENTLAFNQFTLNSNAGPDITESGNAVHMWDSATHANYTSSGTAISVASLGVGRAAMQNQTSLDGLKLNITPRYLLTAPSEATLAEQYCSAAFQATANSGVNPFAGKLVPLSDANLAVTKWYLFADPAMAETFVYGYLSGSEGPRFATQQGFETEGVDLKLALDIGVGAVDFRGTYKNAGA